MKYIGIVTEGIEDIAAEEVKGKKKEKQRIQFEEEKEEYKTIELIYEFIEEFEFNEKEDILEKIKTIKIPLQDPFRVTCRREGAHLFIANDIEKEVGEMIHEQGHPVSLKEPKTTVFLDIKGQKCSVGLLVKKDLEKRGYRVRRNASAIDACLASAVIKIANPEKDESIFDPLCKDGVIGIEAALRGYRKVYASDIFENNIRNAKINARMAKVELNWREPEEKSDYIVTNLWVPGKYEGAKRRAQELIKEWRTKINKKVVIVTNWKNLEKVMEGYKIEEKRAVQRGEVKNYIFVASKDVRISTSN